MRRCKTFSASAWADSAALTRSASSLARRQQRRPLVGRRPYRPACWPPSVRPRRLSAAEIAARRAASASASASTRPGSSPRACCDARTAVRVFSQHLQVDHGHNPTGSPDCAAQPPMSPPAQLNPITLQLHHLSQHPTRLSQWSGCRRHPNAQRKRVAGHGLVAQPPGRVDPARPVADRARRSADRRRDHRAARSPTVRQPHRQLRSRSAPAATTPSTTPRAATA